MPETPRGGCLLLVGADRARKLQRIQAIERSFRIAPLDRHQLDAAALTAADLISTCRALPAESPLRLVVVDQAHRLEAVAVTALVALADVIARNAWVVFLVETTLSARHPLAQASAIVTVEEFPARDVAAAKPFALTDALGRRDCASALLAVREQLLAGKDAIEVLGLVGWQLQRWVAMKRLMLEGCPADAAASRMGIKPWQAQRLQAEVSQAPLAQLQALLQECWEADRQLRSSRAVPELALEQLVAAICTGAGADAKR